MDKLTASILDLRRIRRENSRPKNSSSHGKLFISVISSKGTLAYKILMSRIAVCQSREQYFVQCPKLAKLNLVMNNDVSCSLMLTVFVELQTSRRRVDIRVAVQPNFISRICHISGYCFTIGGLQIADLLTVMLTSISNRSHNGVHGTCISVICKRPVITDRICLFRFKT